MRLGPFNLQKKVDTYAITLDERVPIKKAMGYNCQPNIIEPCKPYQYQGQYDEFGKKCGFGRWTYNGNNIYEGMWKDDVQSGYGRFIYQNGGYYEGEYKNGHRSG
jgi:hypothetical protein